MVANEFIDRYLADANGEYVKVYLYLLRHASEKLDVGFRTPGRGAEYFPVSGRGGCDVQLCVFI